MIVTFTPNPSIDATMRIDKFVHGGVTRADTTMRQPGGKGINVAHGLHTAGIPTVAIAPARADDQFTALATAAGIPLITVEVPGAVRTNTTLVEADGTTSKINEPGATLTPAVIQALEAKLLDRASNASAVVLAGSLPPGTPEDWYVTLIGALRMSNPDMFIAVDSSGAPLRAIRDALPTVAPDLLAPNALELSELVPIMDANYRDLALSGNLEAVFGAALSLIDRGVAEVLVTLGSVGACLATSEGAWYCPAGEIDVQSTAGAGDNALAGYLIAQEAGADAPESLRHAVAYGTAAARLPGTAVVAPDDARTELTPAVIAYDELK